MAEVTREGFLNIILQKEIYQDHIDLIMQAYDIAEKAHSTQIRESGEPYFNHPVEVAIMIIKMNIDYESVITAILHDTVEDTSVTLQDIENDFGKDIRNLVDGVTKLTKIKYQPDYIRQAENFRKLLLAISSDIRVLIIKLFDRLHNMRTLIHVKSQNKRQRIAHETMDIYSMLAERIGMHAIKNELQDLSFRELHSEARQAIVKRLKFLKKNKCRSLITNIQERLTRDLNEAKVDAEMIGREKTPCSIWLKMDKKYTHFDQLSDIIAFRIIVKNIEDCYRVLGVVHTKYKLVPDHFKDFISIPKSNQYQSLHTVIIGPYNQRLEIQIRTEEMDAIANLGIAAHWSL